MFLQRFPKPYGWQAIFKLFGSRFGSKVVFLDPTDHGSFRHGSSPLAEVFATSFYRHAAPLAIPTIAAEFAFDVRLES